MAKELLKEAIADAKAVREVALQNAKMALEEAFDSKIKSMLSAKLAEEIEEDVELEEVYEEDETSEGMSYEEDDKDEANEEVELEEDIDEEINLDELMAELEEMSDTYEEDDVTAEGEDVELEEGEETVDEGLKNLLGKIKDIATSTNDHEVGQWLAKQDPKLIAKAKDDKAAYQKLVDGLRDEFSSVQGGDGSAMARRYQSLSRLVKNKELNTFITRNATGVVSALGEEETNESFDIDALISEIEAELEEGKKADDDEVKEAKKKDDEEKKQMEEELAEALSTVTALQETISEMNLLNSKLLYCNKLFRANSLNESQKVKVVDALDKASTTGEAKLVFETLQESFTFTGVEKRAIKEGLGRASKPAGVAPQKVLSESVDETVSRFQKLANINK
jgi:hypothetical protein